MKGESQRFNIISEILKWFKKAIKECNTRKKIHGKKSKENPTK